MFSVRLVNADSYQAQPLPQLDPTFSEFRGSEIKHVPIIRIFGTTSNGEKTCLHIHGVFPYLYVPYTGEKDPTSLAYRLSASLDAAINVSLGSATSNTQHVYLIQHVSGIPFYGYHRKEHQYLKIYFYNPAMIKRAADLLQNGSVLNQSLQPHEAHIPYILQFMMDYNVYGMSFVNLSSVKHRRLTQTLAEFTSSGQSTTSENSDIEYLPATIERQSTCELEIDALASNIMNRREIESGLELNPGLAAIWDEERARRALAGFPGGDSQLVNPKSPPRPPFRPTDNDVYQEQRLARRLLMISQCDESSLSTTPNQSVAYAAEVKEVGTDDAQLVDLLVQLAGGDGENKDSIDLDSLLGSQVSPLRNGEKSDNEEEDDDVVDLNLTSLQLDSLNSLEILAERANEPLKSDEKDTRLADLSPFILSCEDTSSSRSTDEEKARQRCQVPQYDGAGDVSPTLLNSDDEDNDTQPKEFSHLPEYNGRCDSASQSRKVDNLEHALKLPSNSFVMTKGSEKSGKSCRSSSPGDAALQSPILHPVLVADEYIGGQYHDSNYEPLDRLLEIGPDFAPDLEGLHSSMEIGILLSSADSDSPESVDEAPEDDAIPLETVLNGDPCFTESAELDKSDLTELQDQYVSLLGNSLLPDVHANLRIDRDLENEENFSDSDYQTGEKTCEILLSVPSPRSSITSCESSSSSENVAPNIQEPEIRSWTKDKFNASYAPDGELVNCKDSARISTDNSDYNCNVVASWAELENLQSMEKEKMEGRLGRGKERGQHSQGARQNRRRANRRSDERATSQILGLDSDKITTDTSTLSTRQDANNYPLLPRKIVTNSESESPIRKMTNSLLSPVDAHVTILKKRLTETPVDNEIKEKCPASPRVPDIAAEVEIAQQTISAVTETHLPLHSSHETVVGAENDACDAEDSSSVTQRPDQHENTTKIVSSEETLENRLDSPIATKETSEGYSYYSSERSQRDYNAGFAHWHCQFAKQHKIIQDEVFTADQVWVIEKRKRGRQSRRVCSGVCMRGDCSLPIVPLKKIVDKNNENPTIVENSVKIVEGDSSLENKTPEPSAKKRIGPKNHLICRKLRVERNPTDSSSSDSDEDVTLVNAEFSAEENETKELISEPIPGKMETTREPESSEAAPSSVNERSNSAGDLAHNTYGIRRRYSRKKRSRVRSSKKMISLKSSRPTRNSLVRRVTHLAKHENDNLPGIPGIPGVGEYRSKRKRGRPRKDVFTYYNGVSSDNMPTESPRKTKNKMQPVLFTNWESKRGISGRRPNALVNYVENGLSCDNNNPISPDRRTINFPPVSEPKRNRSPHDNHKDVTSSINRASTPKKIVSAIHALTEDKLSDCVTLNLMMREVKSRSTRAKLKILLEKRRNKTTNNFRDIETKTTAVRTSLSSEKPLKVIENETPATRENPEFPSPISVAEQSTKKVEEIDGPEEADNTGENVESSFDTVTDISEVSEKILEPKVHVTLSADLCNTENTEASGFFEAELEITQNKIPEVNHVEELFNERKELFYQSDQFMTTIAETNFFSGNNYTIDAVSLEIPACLFEEDSNSIEKRSSRKIDTGDAKISNDSQNSHDTCSDVSVDYRDLDVYDVESLTPSSSHATLNEATLDSTEMSLTFSEIAESRNEIIENSAIYETNSVSAVLEKSGSDLKSESILDSSFEEASPEFEALSPSPKISDLIEPSEEEFAVHSTVAILETERRFDHSSTYTTDDSRSETPGGKVSGVIDNSELDHEIQDLVSQVVVQIENEPNLPCDSEAMFIEVFEKNSKKINENSEIVSQDIWKPETLSRTEREKKTGIAAQEDEKLRQISEFNNSAPSEILAKENNSFEKETDSQIEYQEPVSPKSNIIDTRYESKDEHKEPKSIANDENDFVAAAQNDIPSEEELGSISKDALPERSSKCRTVSIKLVNIDLTRFEGLRSKYSKCRVTEPDFPTEQNSLLSSADNIVEHFENIDPVKVELQEPTIDDDKERKSGKTRITWESSTLIAVSDELQSLEPTSAELSPPSQIPYNNKKIVNTLPMESTTRIEHSKKGEKFEKSTTTKSSSSIVTSDAGETFEMAMPIETRTSSQNGNKTKRMFKKSRLPARRSRRKCAEKTRQKLAQQTNLQLSSAESQPSAEESDVATGNLKSESRLRNESENLLTHEITISESELNNVFHSLKYASAGVHPSYLTEEDRGNSTVEIKVQDNLPEKLGTENSLECVLSMQKMSNGNRARYVKWGKRCRSENSSQANSRDTSPEINASTEENTSADENVKPKTRLHVYSRRCHRRCRRKRRPVPPQLKLALQKQAKISPDSQTLLQRISPDKTDQENSCSLHHRLTSQNIADTNTKAKDPLLSDEKFQGESKTLVNEKKLLTSDLLSPIINRNIINSQSSQSPKGRHRSANVPDEEPSIETKLDENSRDAAVKKSRVTKVFSETIVKEKNDAIMGLEDDNSRNTSDRSESRASKIVEDEEPRISTNLKRRDLREKIIELRSRRTSPKENARNSEGFVSSSRKIAIEISSLDIFVGKRRRRTKKMLSSSAGEPCSKILPAEEETMQNTVDKTLEISEEFSLRSRKIEKENAASKNSDNAEVSQSCESNTPIKKNAQDITEYISHEVETTSQKIKEHSAEPESSVKATKKGRPRKFLESNAQKAFENTEESTSEIAKFKSRLPHKTKDKNIDSTILVSAENITEQSSQELESPTQQIVEKSEQEACLKPKKKGRSRKVLPPNIEEPSTESLQSIDVKNFDHYEKSESQETEKNDIKSKTQTLNSLNLSPEQNIESLSPQKILEHRVEPETYVKVRKRGRPRKVIAWNSRKRRQPNAQISQNLEHDENMSSNFKAVTPELSDSKPSSAEKSAQLDEEKISKVFLNKINDEDVKSKTSVNPSLCPISIDEKYNKEPEPTKNQHSSSSAEEKAKSETPQNLTNFHPNNQKVSADSETTPAEAHQDGRKEVLQENTLSFSKSAREILEPIMFDEPTGRSRSRKRQPDNALLSQSQSLMEENDRDISEDLQKPEILSQAVENNNSEPKIMTKRRGHSEKSSELVVKDIHTHDNSKLTGNEIFEILEKTGTTARRRGRSEKMTNTNNPKMDSTKENSGARTEKKSLEETKSLPKRGRSGKATDTNNPKMDLAEENYGVRIEKKSLEEMKSLPKRGRSGKATDTNNPKMGSAEENAGGPTEEKSLDETKLPPRRGRSGKATDTNNSIMDSVEENCGAPPEKESLDETKLPSKITEQVNELASPVQAKKKGCFAKITNKPKTSTEKDNDRGHDVGEDNSQKPHPLWSELRNTNKKGRQCKISTTSIENGSQESTSSSEEISLKLSSENEVDSEPQISVATKKRSRAAKKSEFTETIQEQSQVIASKIIENAAEPKSPSRRIKRTRLEKSPESTETIADGRLSEASLSPWKVPNEIIETRLTVKPPKRVRFDEESIRNCTEQLRPSEQFVEEEIAEVLSTKHKKCDPSPTKIVRSENNSKSKKICRTTRATAANLSRDVFELKDQLRQTKKPAIPEGNNGVAAKSECTISSSDNASLDLPSLQEVSTRHRRSSENSRGFPKRGTKSRVQEQAIQSAQKQRSKEMQPNHSGLEPVRKNQVFTNSGTSLDAEPTRCRSKPFLQNHQPNIILQRLSTDTLKIYGVECISKNNTIKTKNLKKYRPDPDYQVPAYDGPADLSSSESDDDPADVTLEREEKRVCVYQSGKKATSAVKRESIVTPWKRKLDETQPTQSPKSKHRAIAIPGSSSKTPFRSPNRKSMLKSPGRVSGYYPPLPIIITSPKVRKETSEARDADDVPLENLEIPASTSGCLTPRRKNEQRLHENLLRGRISAMKSPQNVKGDKCATPVTIGCHRPGELDEIKLGEQREQIARNISTITSECDRATGNHNFTSTLRGGKDVRKKLVFSTAEHERQTDQIPIEGLDYRSTNFSTSSESIEHSSTVNDAQKSVQVLENLANREITPPDPQPGPSHSDGVPVDENLALYEVTTDEDSEEDNVCNVTFTQYIHSQIEKNRVLTLDRSKIAEETRDIVSLRPKFNPPNSQRIVDTMESYGIPKYRNQEPFFSNEADVPKQKELAQKMLKVPGKGLKDLPCFISSLEDVTGITRWRKMKVNELQPALAKSKSINAIRALVGDDVVSLTPLIKPPTQKDVKNWLRARHYLAKKKNKKNEHKKQEQNEKKTNEPRDIEIQDEIAGTEDKECGPNDLDLSVIEASPEKTVGPTDSGNMENCTLKMKLAKRELLNKAKDSKKCRLLSSERKKVKDSGKASASSKGTSQNSSSTEADPSLISVLGKSDLFKDKGASRHLGVSCGQIEFLSDSTRSDVANENLQNAKAFTRYQYLTIMNLEVHVSTRGDLLPDAQRDSISAIFYSVQSDVPPTSNIKPLEHGVIVLADDEKAKNKMHYSYASKFPWSICFADNEEALLNALVTLITRTDPEILIGWELETLSWGYVFQRATHLGMNLSKRISRIPATQCKWETPAPDIESMAEVKLPGRIVLDIWRVMRHEAALLNYTFESVMHHVLNERVPCPSFKTLTDWWNLKRDRPSRWRVIEHYSFRVLGVFRMLDQLDIIGRTSELARLFGIQFYEVFSRGSQYRVESVMLRLAKPLNYVAVSPTPLQRASMRAMEALPLILEPESKFYSDPLIVLDFQSLYPSIIIAHNYCFSTCLGRIEHIGQSQPFEFGAYTLRVTKGTALKLEGKVNYAPCGVAYVKPEVRLGILPRMLTEILETRFMVKKAMKDHKQADKTLQRALHSRQHGLKFLANVTYGYTAANFSGRMPCIEVGDSVISKSKETLERAIKLVEATPKWGARVVYGDTDSLFILVPGKTKADAFVIGNEIADAVTASNPPPIKLKFEKVLYPSILQTKKRYCGYMYETPDQQAPTYLAKGIETVRRDGCPAVSKILEKTLKILFETKDVSLVKKYVTRQLDKVLRGKVSIQDLTFAKEFRGLKGYKAKACVPALELTRRLMRKDHRAVPRTSERVRYVIVAGAPNQALIHCVRTPWELINDPGLRPNAIYYVTRVIIPPLNRCLNLMGVDVNDWYREMPHRQILTNPIGQPVDKQKLTIFQYFGTIVCVSCGEPSNKGICGECLASPADTLVVLHEKLRWLHRTYDHVTAICQSCVGQTDIGDCSSLACPVLYRRAQAQRELSQATHLQSIIESGNILEF